jgi:hypothetical protein
MNDLPLGRVTYLTRIYIYSPSWRVIAVVIVTLRITRRVGFIISIGRETPLLTIGKSTVIVL